MIINVEEYNQLRLFLIVNCNQSIVVAVVNILCILSQKFKQNNAREKKIVQNKVKRS